MTDRHKNSITLSTRVRPAVVAVFRRRAAAQGRTLNEYMMFLLEDQAFRDHDRARTERQRRKREQAKEAQP